MKDIKILDHKRRRFEGYDYSTGCYYFITIVTIERRELFGKICNYENILNDTGQMVEEQLESVTATFDDAEIINKVVMPNHIHFILFNGKNNSVFQIMRKFKAITTWNYRKGINEIEWENMGKHLWQKSYYDVIIRNSRMFDLINRYIEENPKRWNKDKMNAFNDGDTDNILKDLNELRL